MRTARILGRGTAYYHCMSRIIEGKAYFTAYEKERFRKILRQVAGFCGIEILTYALMNNHVHMLIQVPEKCVIEEKEVLRRINILYGRVRKKTVAYQLRKLREENREAEADMLLQSYTYRMHDLSQFMKTVMQKFTQSYNKRHERRGHLWENRFKSLLVEGKPAALSTMAAYIDLNAVRAGLVKDPKDYRFCGYGEAVSGNRDARDGIRHLAHILGQEGRWDRLVSEYRKHLFMQADAHRKKGSSIEREKIQEVLDKGGKLSMAELLQCRLRYLSDGVVLGSKNFVEDVFQDYRSQFSAKRKHGARKPRYGEWGELHTMRDLRLKPVSLSATK